MGKNNYFKKILKMISVCTCFCTFLTCVYANPPETQECKKEGETRVLSCDIPTNFGGTSDSGNSFFSFISRLRYVNRWALFKNSETEDLADHSAEVAFLAHALAVIKNKKFGGKVNAERAALLGLYHDTPELITGDMPSPVKYFGKEMKPLYDKIEKVAVDEMISMLPEEFADDFKPLLCHTEEEKELWQIVKNADILSALIKCLREKSLKNPDFDKPLNTITEKLKTISEQCPEVDYFIKEFMPSFGFKL